MTGSQEQPLLIPEASDGDEENPPRTAPRASAQLRPAGKAWLKLLGVFALGAILWFVQHPAEIRNDAWHLLAIFLATIVGIVLQAKPTGALAAMAAAVAMLTRTLTFKETFQAFSAEVPWLIAIAMFLAEAVTASGLGKRVAYTCVSAMGGRPLGLAYALVFAEALMSPAIPSVAARSGGIILPLAKGFCEASGSRPRDGTERRLGAFLMVTCFQTAAVSSAMFLTANHPNPLSAQFAESVIGRPITWGLWAKAAFVPGAVCLLLLPLVVYTLCPPTLKESAHTQLAARQQLKEMGGLSRAEGCVLASMAVTVGLWVCGDTLGLSVVAAAMTGLSLLLVSEVLTWKQCLDHGHAWDTMWWFAIIIALATQLKTMGVIAYFSDKVSAGVADLGWGWQPSFVVLLLVYYYSHYLFASNVAHVSAMYSAFLAVMVAAGTPGLLAALVLAFVSNMMGALGTWTMSHAPLYYGEGYVSQAEWLKLGFVSSLVNMAVWLAVGGAWWKVLGLW